MANQAKQLNTVRKNLTKDEISARQQAEKLFVTNETHPVANDVVSSNKVMLEMFNRLVSWNDYFTEADSIPLNTLTFNLYLKYRNENKLSSLQLDDEQYERYLVRLEKINKQVNECMKQLCIPLNNRLSLSNNMAKIMIEEKKLEKLEKESEPKEINPAYAILASIEKMNKGYEK